MSADGDATSGGIVFTDLVGFTELTARAGDETALVVLERQERVVRDLLPHGSRVVKELGDGLLLWFPDPATALATAVALQERLAWPAGDDDPLWIRVGAHWGAPLRRGDDLVGHDVNVAARIVELAGPGEVLASEPLVRRLDAAPDLVELGPVVMRGIPDPVRLYRITLQPGARPGPAART